MPPELQLLAVLPAQSAPLLPPAMRPLVEEKGFPGCLVGWIVPVYFGLPKNQWYSWPLQESSSSIADFYPREFQLDLKPGDKDWQVPWG